MASPLRIVGALLVSLALFGTTDAVGAQEMARLKADVARIRQSADIASPIVFSLQKGARVEVLTRDSVWARIRSEKREGFVRLTQLEFTMSPVADSSRSTGTRSSGASSTTHDSLVSPVRVEPRSTTSPVAPPPTAAVSPKATARPLEPSRRTVPSHLIAIGASVTAATVSTSKSPSDAHYAGHLLVQLAPSRLGLVGSGALGRGDGYQSTQGSIALSMALLRAGSLRLDALAGGTYYGETLSANHSAHANGIGTNLGGMLQVRLVGPFRAALVGSLTSGKWRSGAAKDANLRFSRVLLAVGL